MGCDIHMYVEYANIENNKRRMEIGEPPYWKSFGGRINPGRDYILFGYLSKGVRYDTDKGFEARGLPDNLGFYSISDSRMFIIEDSDETDSECVRRSTAMDWNRNYGCKLHYNNNGVAIYVDIPDWHSASWLTTKEFEKAIKLREKDKYTSEPVDMGYKALLAAMKSFEKTKQYEARVVFWFDN